MTWLLWTTGAALALTGLTLTLRALFADRARGRKRCPKCWYDMSGVTPAPDGHTCPECGHNTPERNLTRTRRRWRRAAIGALLLIAGLTAALYPQWSPWLDVDHTPSLLLSVTYPMLGDAAQDRAYQRLVNLADVELIIFPFEKRECKLMPFEMRRLVNISLRRVKDERLFAQQRKEALVNLYLLGDRTFRVQPGLTRVALDGDDWLHVMAGVLALLFSRDGQTMLETRRRLAEQASPPVALFASAFSITDEEDRAAMLTTGDAQVDWVVEEDWSFVAARLEQVSAEEQSEWVEGAIALIEVLRTNDSQEEEVSELRKGIIQLFERFDLPVDRLRTNESQP